MPLVLLEARHEEPLWFFRRRSPRTECVRPGVDAVADDREPFRVGAVAQQEGTVVLGDRDHEGGGAHLALEPELADEDVVRVRCEAVGDPGEPRDHERAKRWICREMSMNVL